MHARPHPQRRQQQLTCRPGAQQDEAQGISVPVVLCTNQRQLAVGALPVAVKLYRHCGMMAAPGHCCCRSMCASSRTAQQGHVRSSHSWQSPGRQCQGSRPGQPDPAALHRLTSRLQGRPARLRARLAVGSHRRRCAHLWRAPALCLRPRHLSCTVPCRTSCAQGCTGPQMCVSTQAMPAETREHQPGWRSHSTAGCAPMHLTAQGACCSMHCCSVQHYVC